MEFTTDILSVFDKKWALLTAGNGESFNTMTISWGGLGTIWGKPVATVYVRTSRYTHDFMDANEFFTVSFYPEECRQILGVLGSKSGRDMDKMKESGLTPVQAVGSMSFKEAEVTLVCRKLFRQQLDVANMPEDVAKAMYEGQAPHDMYIGEIVDIIR
ncbi:MAG: flavin reductase family protein [Lachnospiraceae bacterium]|nr:flavin reductase family protein [Lachnospiraceae bacterium]